jgi:Transcriptional regulator, contains sigma factor-related N-terminal domain
MAAPDNEKSRLDEAARAGWLYFIAGHTQDEIAKMLKVSRASAQRLVSLCLAERLITFRLEHPIAACMELAARLKDLFHLAYCEVVPTDPAAPLSAAGIAERAASVLESTLRNGKPTIVALGTGRAVRAAVERVSPIDCPNHQIVSLVGNISADGSASFFDTGRAAGRPNQGAALSDAAAVSDVVRGRTRPDAQDRSNCQGEGGRSQGRLAAGRDRPDGPARASAY